MARSKMIRHGSRLMALSTVSLGLVAAMAVPAAAADEPTREQLIADCASGEGKCTFNEPKLGKAYLGDFRQVSNSLYNCSTSDATQSMGWSDTVGSTDSAGVSVTAGGNIAGIIDLSVTATYSHTWSSSHTENSSLNMTVKPGEVGWISRAQVMQTVTGTWQTHYDSPKWDHYYWFVPDTVTGPAPNGTDGQSNAVTVKTRKMTTAEKKSCSAESKQGQAFVVKR
ncbi:hypothetical protein YWIDRAFT_00528 [Streptomyces sp. SceaMP-e96]|uniref:Secreted protein n=2 Tax=Streptomyces nigrescens TaxID=1920 RepID=A0ABY7ISJ1_STRNI|nr:MULTISPECIES: hypothetical protein [Streptomyces]MCW7988571.1 hypothetical protein [Streptomyces platensis subsp. clarensis]WAU01293.1 hypothetical protein STRLI_007621 [Streptomyces libani subsp. libani]WDT52854.1 hypothetical protein NUT86_01770 [Streptomyces sp. G7(2002)]SCK08537.1 hypothetical protein YWIDRAFT_00528 [Streptomyces sp. SceaMP-e96]